MKKLIILTLAVTLFACIGCKTTASFTVPKGTNLFVDNTELTNQETKRYKCSPFFWSKTTGIPYRLEKDGEVVEQGKLKSTFRVSSIFWPPFSIIYSPMKFDGPYDLTQPNEKVRPETTK
jgi:hypothetical protein